MFSSQTRQEDLKRVESQIYDLVIIGGGITGAGVARDAASRGLKVALFEQNDFASGTSSRSSKLIHGGIRYLENLEFGLVFEALNERHVLFEIAPHLVHPLTFLLPVFRSDRVGFFKLGLGMWLYDALALFHAPKFHERLNSTETLHRLPQIQNDGLLGSYIYSDAYMDDDRLVIETLRSASSYGAQCFNYSQVKEGVFDEKNKLKTLIINDLENNESYKVSARHFISTVGPWTDRFAETLIQWKKILRPSKGIHLVIPRERLPLHDAVVMAANQEKRIIFAIPRGAVVIIGTTDTDFSDDPSLVKSDSSDVKYLLEIVNQYFPKLHLETKDIISSYAGVRPLVYDGSQNESKTSREHVILSTPQNVTFVAGGKYTTYRRMARDIVETVLKNEFTLEERIRYARNQTREAINPLVTLDRHQEALAQSILWAAEFGYKEKETLELAERHGLEALEIIEKAEKHQVDDPLSAELLFACDETLCLHLKDFMLRRSSLFLTRFDHGLSEVDKLGGLMQKHLNWSDSKLEAEKQKYIDHIQNEMGWRAEIKNG